LVSSPLLRLGLVIAALVFSAAAQRVPLFKNEIQPIFEKNCVKCHGPEQKMAGLDLSDFAPMMAGSSSGPVIAPGKADRSLLWKMIENDQMPMGGEKLNARDKEEIRSYIEQGRFPTVTEDPGVALARDHAKIKPQDRRWWSFVKPVKPAIPQVKNRNQVQTPIDNFVLAKLEEKGWQMEPTAERVTLIRRAYLDLTGLPPSPAEVQAFVENKSANAWERVVDSLLASEHYGEQWGRHWLDLAGYSDSRGDAGDTDREVSWKYRDYVIRAINKNKPINRFILEQMAGDQMVNYQFLQEPRIDQIEALTATGFLRTTADITDNQTIYEIDKYYDAQQKVMETSLHALLGITIQCARCHDHKFDPLTQRDYYSLMAVYAATWDPDNWLAGNLKYGPWPSRNVLNMPDRRNHQHQRQGGTPESRPVGSHTPEVSR
jgi:hypothetical protein